MRGGRAGGRGGRQRVAVGVALQLRFPLCPQKRKPLGLCHPHPRLHSLTLADRERKTQATERETWETEETRDSTTSIPRKAGKETARLSTPAAPVDQRDGATASVVFACRSFTCRGFTCCDFTCRGSRAGFRRQTNKATSLAALPWCVVTARQKPVLGRLALGKETSPACF